MTPAMQEAVGKAKPEVLDEDDGWHWPSLLYIAMHILHLSEQDFWAMRPVTFVSLFEAYRYANSVDDNDSNKKQKAPAAVDTTIDQAPSWW